MPPCIETTYAYATVLLEGKEKFTFLLWSSLELSQKLDLEKLCVRWEHSRISHIF